MSSGNGNTYPKARTGRLNESYQLFLILATDSWSIQKEPAILNALISGTLSHHVIYLILVDEQRYELWGIAASGELRTNLSQNCYWFPTNHDYPSRTVRIVIMWKLPSWTTWKQLAHKMRTSSLECYGRHSNGITRRLRGETKRLWASWDEVSGLFRALFGLDQIQWCFPVV